MLPAVLVFFILMMIKIKPSGGVIIDGRVRGPPHTPSMKENPFNSFEVAIKKSCVRQGMPVKTTRASGGANFPIRQYGK